MNNIAENTLINSDNRKEEVSSGINEKENQYDMFQDAVKELNVSKESKNESSGHNKQEAISKNKKENMGSSFEKEDPKSKEGLKNNKKKDFDNKATDEKKEPDFNDKLKKAEKMAYDNQRYARYQNQKMTDSLKLIQSFIENGDLDEEVAETLTEQLSKKMEGEGSQGFTHNVIENPDHPLDQYKKKITPEVFNTYLEATSDMDAQLKLKAFDYYLSEASEEEMNNIEEMLGSAGSPVGILRAVLNLGEEQLNNGYREVLNYGGFRGFYRETRKEMDDLRKKLDKVTGEYENKKKEASESWLGSDSSGANDIRVNNSGDMFADIMSEK